MSHKAHIRSEHIEAIVNAIKTWRGDTISWENVRKLAKPILGYLPSRSGVNAHPEIQNAHKAKAKGLEMKPGDRIPAPKSLATAGHLIAVRDAEIAELKLQITAFREKFDRWRYNASKHNIKIDELDAPLPTISRKQ